jgi:hypothetical protein
VLNSTSGGLASEKLHMSLELSETKLLMDNYEKKC